MAKAGRTAGIEPRCRSIAEQMGYELVEIAMDREPAGMMLRFYIDRPEGISLDDCEAYHKAVRALADEIDYDYMEVSSPGIDRPLKTERDFERNLGSEIEVHLFRPLEGSKRWTGILAGLEGADFLLETDGETRRIPRKAASLVKPVVDMEGVEDVDLSGDETEPEQPDPENETERNET
ncbi:MAG: ribosome maturation factor RimP [Clostridia bacterium]|nr:ribosome maturation factor RimP [Clostridia bacterium]